MPAERTFEYLLNAMERAGDDADPPSQGYSNKRQAVFAYVRTLEKRLADAREAERTLESIEKILASRTPTGDSHE